MEFMDSAIPSQRPRRRGSRRSAFTLAEVMVAMFLVLFALAGIYTMQAQSLRIVQSAHDSSAASQVLQQRLEQLRVGTYDTVTTASGLTALMNGTAGATQSETNMTAVKNFQETVKLSRCPRPGVSPPPLPGTITVIRGSNTATSSGLTTDLHAETQIKAQLIVAWTDRQGSHQREFTTVFSRGGVSAAGVSKRPETSSTPLAAVTP